MWLLPWENPMRQQFDDAFFRGIPNTPGVYIMLNAAGEVIYIGKSCRLRSRLLSYRSANQKQVSRKVLRLISTVRDIRWEPCKTDDEASMRENFLLRNFRPGFNVMNTKPFTYFFMVLEANETCHRWQLTLNPEEQAGAVVCGAFKGRRITKLAYQALLRLEWAWTHRVRAVADFPHDLVVNKAPRKLILEVTSKQHEELFPLMVDYLQGNSDALLLRCGEWLAQTSEQRAPFLQGWLEAELETLNIFYERTLLPHRTMRESLPGNPAIIPQEKVDDLMMMHKNAHPKLDETRT
jgi:excinuclease UvrABC nuclease subunit